MVNKTRDFEVKPLFAEPYFRTNILDAITPKQVEFIKNMPMRQSHLNKISNEMYLLEYPEMRSIRRAIEESLAIYASEVMGIPQSLAITQSWCLVTPPGIGMHGHTHSNSLVSGSLYYTDLPNPPGNMLFERHSGYQQFQLEVKPEKTNIYNSSRNAVVPQKGDLIIFPSSLVHYVDVNQTQQNRYSMAFNSFIRGKIGVYGDASELIVK